ncbi:hypothetical protein D9611_011606 [Ephemerocybe angulata]|uniref:Uncharacterized protein n=1 Tax=Ephemerocybe angulata TaxID=980116 RepID=A0A8H5ET75_9AGAR|nr:hypothetical protein D9611_011606 [Tulosesus angulatus]
MSRFLWLPLACKDDIEDLPLARSPQHFATSPPPTTTMSITRSFLHGESILHAATGTLRVALAAYVVTRDPALGRQEGTTHIPNLSRHL